MDKGAIRLDLRNLRNLPPRTRNVGRGAIVIRKRELDPFTRKQLTFNREKIISFLTEVLKKSKNLCRVIAVSDRFLGREIDYSPNKDTLMISVERLLTEINDQRGERLLAEILTTELGPLMELVKQFSGAYGKRLPEEKDALLKRCISAYDELRRSFPFPRDVALNDTVRLYNNTVKLLSEIETEMELLGFRLLPHVPESIL